MPRWLLPLALVLGSTAAVLPQSERTVPAHPQHATIDINHASLNQLMTLPGITAVWANRILNNRPYRTKQDLLDHGIIPVALYNRIRDTIIAHRNPD